MLHFLGVYSAFFGVFLKYYMFCFSDIDWLNGALLSDLQPQLPPEGVGIAGKGPFTSLQPFIPHLFIRRFLHHLSPIHTTTTTWCSETKYIKNLKKKWFSKKKNAHLSQLDTRKEKILCPSCFSRPTTWSLFLLFFLFLWWSMITDRLYFTTQIAEKYITV